MNRNLRTPAAESDVTEQQEISEIYNLLLLANDKIESGKLKDAKALGVEALEIDETSLEVLSLLVNVNIKLRKYEEAFVYAESMIEMHPDDPLGPLCKARVQCEMKHYRDCITSSLQSLSMGYGKHKELSTLIVRAVQEILGLSEDFTESLKDMDYYSQLGEVGIVLLAAKQNILVIQILEVALKLQTMQYGVSMRIYLTQGHAFCAVQKYEAALKAYEKCYQMAVSTHDVAHQTKALVNTAALHVSLGKTYKALVVYERLLDMHSRLLSDQEVCEDVWTEEFISVLHMNTSIAYKTVGNIDMALHYAQKYLRNMEQTEDFSGLSLIHKHMGTLYETVCQYSHAISHYNSFLAMAKCSGDSIQIALAYGHLGSVYGQIGLWPISLVYHDRHVCGVFNVLNSLTNADNLAKDLARINEVKKGVVQVYDMYGDTMMRRKDYEEANNLYQLMYKYCERGPLNKSRALYKTGNSHFAMGNSQHALHYYEQALALCDDEFVHLMEDIKQSIDSLKTRIQECLQHHKFLPRELLQKLDNSFQGIQTVLAKLGCDAECLEYTEDSRIFATRLTSKAAVFSRLPLRLDFNALSSIVKSQGATILYYSFLPNSLLIWLLSPEKGLHRFYVKKPQKLTGSVEAELKALLDPWLCSLEKEYSKKETRKAGVVRSPRKRLKSSILKRGSSWSTAERKNLVGQQTLGGESNESLDVLNTEDDSQNQIERKLYKFLVSPVDDILSKVVKKGNLIIIPDKVIGQVPFSQIRDLKGKHLGDRFNITYLSGLFALKLVAESNSSRQSDTSPGVRKPSENLQLEDEVNFLRSQSSLGGYYRYLHASEIQYCEDGETAARSTKDRRKMANPRLDVILSSEVSNKSKLKQPEENLALDNTRKMAGEEAHVTGCSYN
ncbi:hypothetical protein EB796_007864 [Bugula neritina]|uniref:CHAT domain-containing protein n=1 Tax=Bugula neritina TaxID=10212 RepID=A0A7J7K6E7_BUGNE|nr:hypothetical protein EB796_007864 [Bugula neritina]